MLPRQDLFMLAILASSALAVMVLNREIQKLMRRNTRVRAQLLEIAAGAEGAEGDVPW
jgi:hypothetical protein